MLAFIGYILFSLAAVAGLAFMLHRLGQSERFRLEDGPQAEAQFRAEFPEAQIEQTVISQDGHSALLALAPAEIGVVRAMGQFPVIRRFGPEMLRKSGCEGAAITLHLKDFTDPKIQIVLRDDESARHWQKLIEERCHAGNA